jgi:DivIVA domain
MRPSISALEIRKRQFPKRFRGFDPAEVTNFLDAFAEDLEEMSRELDELERETRG